MIAVLIITYLLAEVAGVAEAIILWEWFVEHILITILLVIFLA